MEVQLSGNKISVPPRCCCCDGTPDSDFAASASRTTGKRVVRTQTQSYSFPICQGCLAHVAAWPGDVGCGAVFLIVITVGLALIPYLLLRSAAKARALTMCSPSCAGPSAPVKYLGWHGSSRTFWFASDRFAIPFMRANKSKLVNVDWNVARLLETPPTPRPALEAKMAPPPTGGGDDQALYEAAIAKLEAAKGPAGRRTALDRALKEIGASYLRDRLVLEASRVEVEAALAKADSLKTTSAKRRVLEAALTEIRNDPVPDALQAKQIKWLEEAIAELEP